MFYVLNFYDHSFTTCDSADEAARKIEDLHFKKRVDYDDLEIINCNISEVRLTVDDFFDDFAGEEERK